MQHDIHSSIGVGRFDRRLRPYGHHPPLKCPRCDSLNTKFCYYNNYNLSQPRHFCKSCRRYWTKGGVLRNVPVGGGCRKTKRSKPKSDRNSNRSSSSDSSTHTAAANTAAAPEDVGAPDQSVAALNFTDQSAPAFNFNPPQESEGGQMFGSFTSLMTSHEMLGFRGSDVCGGEEELAAAMNWGDGGVGGCGGDEGLFDLTGRVESGSYWSRSEWTENDQSLNDNDYLP